MSRWWRQSAEAAAVEAEFGPTIDGDEPTDVFVVEHDGEPIGMVQRYRLSDYPEYQQALAESASPLNAAAFDYLIGVEALIGQGIGTQIIRQLVDDTWVRYPDLSSIVVSVQQGNRRSWRVLEKAGFRRTWAGTIDSGDPSDEGPAFVYVCGRPSPA